MNVPPQSQRVRAEDHQAALSESIVVFHEAADRFPAARRRDRPRAGAFSATEIVYHMLAVEDLWRSRFAKLLDGGERQFQAMDPDEDARVNRYNEQDFGQGLEALLSKRQDTIAMLGRLTSDQLALSGIHSKYGEMSIHRMLETMASHDRQHAAQLDRTARELEALNAG